MKTQSIKSWLRPAAGLALAAVLLPAAANATTITLSPAFQSSGVGGSFDLAVQISGLGDHAAPSLGAFDLDVNFDPLLAQFDSISFGDPLLGDLLGPVTPSLTGSALNLTGDALNMFGIALDAAPDLELVQPGQFTLATLHFTGLAVGSAHFDVANVILGDGDGAPLLLDAAHGADVRIGVQSVPEGGVGWLGAMCLGGLALGHRRLTRRSAVA